MTRRLSPRLLLIGALALSVLANMFLLGHAVRNWGAGHDAVRLPEAIGAAYSPEVRAEFRNLLRADRRRALEALYDLREARQRLGAAVNAATLDVAEIERAMQDVRTATEALQRVMQELLLEAVKRTRGPG